MNNSLYMGPYDECWVDVGETSLRAFSLRELAPGTEVYVTFDSADCHLLAAE